MRGEGSSMPLEDKEYWKSLINMSLSKFLVLRTLGQGPVHGYMLSEKLVQFTQGCCTPTFGTIYPILKELLNGKYAKVRLETVDGRKRKVYELTDKGRMAYKVALDAWREVIPYLGKTIEESV